MLDHPSGHDSGESGSDRVLRWCRPLASQESAVGLLKMEVYEYGHDAAPRIHPFVGGSFTSSNAICASSINDYSKHTSGCLWPVKCQMLEIVFRERLLVFVREGIAFRGQHAPHTMAWTLVSLTFSEFVSLSSYIGVWYAVLVGADDSGAGELHTAQHCRISTSKDRSP